MKPARTGCLTRAVIMQRDHRSCHHDSPTRADRLSNPRRPPGHKGGLDEAAGELPGERGLGFRKQSAQASCLEKGV